MESEAWPVISCNRTFPLRQPLLIGLPAEFMEKQDMVPDDMEFDTALQKFKYRVPNSTE